MNAATWLLEFQRDEYSQAGEDGIIEKILEVLPSNDRWCVEFGAWDGVYLTNTRHLILAKNYSAVLIEADRQRFLELQGNYAQQGSRVIPINCFVGVGDDDNLDRILAGTPIPRDFDLLSIDIDGNDYHVWKQVVHYQPKVVVVEFNPTIPTGIEFVQKADPAVNQGSSLTSLVELGREKGYELVCVLPFNAFFVRRQDFHLFQLESNDPRDLRTDSSAITYLFTGFDGTAFLRGACNLPWHGIGFSESDVQPLPSLLRKFPSNYTRLQKIAFAVFRFFRDPARFPGRLRRRFGHLAGRSG